jgi:hypothetical protein
MLFSEEATKLVGKSVRVQMKGHSHSLKGHLSSVGTDFIVMRVRIRNLNRRVVIRLAEILFLSAIL